MTFRDPQPRQQDAAVLRFLYHTLPGRILLRLLSARPLSVACGRFMDSAASKCLIHPFVRKNAIDLKDFESTDFSCFNDCFTRRIRPELRPIDADERTLIAPCDGLLSAYALQEDSIIPAKQSRYSVSALLDNDRDASRFRGGICLVFRLCVHHYHRYCFPDDGRLLRSFFIPGRLHTVRPIALEQRPVFIENCRAVSLLETKHLGLMAQIEVGAMLVGRILNHPIKAPFVRGQEKGMFLYGGSTVILLLEPGRIEIPESIFQMSAQGLEIPVQMGEAIALSMQ